MKCDRLLLVIVLFFFQIINILPLFSQKEVKDSYWDSLKSICNKFPNNPDSSIAQLTQLLQIERIQKNIDKVGKIYYFIGRENYLKKDDFAQAILYLNKALEASKQSGNCHLEIQVSMYLGLNYHRIKKMDSFFDIYEKAASIARNCPESKGATYIHTQLGLNYALKGKNSLAEKHFMTVDSLIDNEKNIPVDDKMMGYNIILDFYQKQKNSTKIQYYAQKAKKLHLNNINRPLQYDEDLLNYIQISDIYKNLGQLDSAIYYMNKLRNLPTQNFLELGKFYINTANREISYLFLQKGDTSQAILAKDRYITYIDSVADSRKTDAVQNKVNLLESQLSLEKKQKDLEFNRLILIFIASLVLVIGGFAGFIYYNARKLRALYVVLNKQKEDLAQQNEIRTKMFSILSHDMLSPLGGLKNMVDLYHDGSFSQEDFKSYTVTLRQNLNTLIKVTRDILGWSHTQLKGEKMFLESLNIYKIIEEQLDIHLLAAQEKEISLINKVPPEFTLTADYNQMSLIARNLIDNAIKYTGRRGTIEISSSDTEGVKKLIFKDNGKGMSAKKVKSLFISKQPKDISYASTNTGVYLGLEMVYDLVKRNNLDISIESKENEGSIFTISTK